MMPIFTIDPFPILKTERLLLRKIEPIDAPTLLELRTNDQVMQYLDRPRLKSLDEAHKQINDMLEKQSKGEIFPWAMSLVGEKEMFGIIGFWQIFYEHFRAEVGYFMLPSFQGKGLMGEALAAVISHGFELWNLHSIQADVNPANAASIRWLERYGFVREAYFRENFFFNGNFLDSAIYSLINKK